MLLMFCIISQNRVTDCCHSSVCHSGIHISCVTQLPEVYFTVLDFDLEVKAQTKAQFFALREE